jgi:hypothetical protein
MERGSTAGQANAKPVPKALVAIALASLCCGCSHSNDGAGAGAGSSPTLPVTSGDYPAFGHAADFSWIAGRLIRSSPAGQCTYVVFSSGRGGLWGGRIALANASKADAFPDGDMVVVEGRLDANEPGICGQPSMILRSIEEH